MSSQDTKSREDVIAAREAKKLAKLKGKNKNNATPDSKPPQDILKAETKTTEPTREAPKVETKNPESNKVQSPKSKDEVDRAVVKDKEDVENKDRDQVKADRAAKKAAKLAKKKGAGEGGDIVPDKDMTVKDVVETLKDIVNVAKEVKDITNKPETGDKEEASGKSKAELRAERRAKQEAQRAAKQAATPATPGPKAKEAKAAVPAAKPDVTKEKSPKPKSTDKTKTKASTSNRVNWFQHLHTVHDKEALNKIPINSNLHPAIIKLGVQLATRAVTGSNARCIALLDALKKMVSDFVLPAKTEFARGLEAHLATSLDFLWSMRAPSAGQSNAVKFFRYHLTQLPNNVDEFDAKKQLHEEIDRYIREQIEKAGEAISLAVRDKISTGDCILTYGRSSLIERILSEAWWSGVVFRCVVVGSRARCGRETLRRLAAAGLPCTYVDITALSYVMKTVDKVLVGASALLVNGSVVGAVGTAQTALVARAHNVPVLVACETHKFSDRVQIDAFVNNEIGDPDELIDKNDENSPLKDWRSNPHLTPLNLTYDVTPASAVSAVVTELAVLPCTSAPVVLRFKLQEYGI